MDQQSRHLRNLKETQQIPYKGLRETRTSAVEMQIKKNYKHLKDLHPLRPCTAPPHQSQGSGSTSRSTWFPLEHRSWSHLAALLGGGGSKGLMRGLTPPTPNFQDSWSLLWAHQPQTPELGLYWAVVLPLACYWGAFERLAQAEERVLDLNQARPKSHPFNKNMPKTLQKPLKLTIGMDH